MNYRILVGKQNKIKRGILKNLRMVTYIDSTGTEAKLEKRTYKALVKLQDIALEKFDMIINTEGAFRSLEHQKKLYKKFIQKYGQEYADAIAAPVGSREHHTGLAFDVAIQVDGKYPESNLEIEKITHLYEKLYPYLENLGLILRYPKGKEAITGYPYEPWHFRYVGKRRAHILKKEGKTLEEYYNFKK